MGYTGVLISMAPHSISHALVCHFACMTALLPALAAFVADVFSTAYPQGPSLPYATRSALMTMFKNDTAMWRTRLQAALQIVRPRISSCMLRKLFKAAPLQMCLQLGCGSHKGRLERAP